MNADDMIAELERLGYRVVTARDDPDTRLRELWDDIQRRLRMARDIAEFGGKLTVRHPAWLNARADAARLLRDNAVDAIRAIFENAVVVREKEMADAD